MLELARQTFFTSDLHLGHKAVIEYSKRPFLDTAQMDMVIVARWNERVKPDDTVYLLGDVSFHKRAITESFLGLLNGRIYLVRGNHDKKLATNRFHEVYDFKEIEIENQSIVLCHYAMRVWNKSHYGSWHLHGHSHGSLPPLGLSLDVGVDCHNFYPVSFEQVRQCMAERSVATVDHHVRKKNLLTSD